MAMLGVAEQVRYTGREMKRPGLVVLASAGLTLALGNCVMPEPAHGCFKRFAPSLPTRDKVRARLSNGETGRAIYDAVAKGDRAAVERLARSDPRLLNTHAVLPDGEAPYDGNSGDLLTFAIAACDPGMVGLLLELGAAPDGQMPGQPLTLALLADDLIMAQMLLQAGAKPDAHGPLNQRPMSEALQFRNLEAVALLLRSGANPNGTDAFGATPLQNALLYGDYAGAKVLMQNGANPWQVGSKGELPARTLAQPVQDRANEAIRQQLEQMARKRDLPWPPPSLLETQDRFASGQWPTHDMRAAGFIASEPALRSIQAAVANRRPAPSRSVN